MDWNWRKSFGAILSSQPIVAINIIHLQDSSMLSDWQISHVAALWVFIKNNCWARKSSVCDDLHYSWKPYSCSDKFKLQFFFHSLFPLMAHMYDASARLALGFLYPTRYGQHNSCAFPRRNIIYHYNITSPKPIFM